jgi:pantoate--beta-alanine ligase
MANKKAPASKKSGPKKPVVARTLSALRKALDPSRSKRTLALVPTMGALHEGHLALVKLAKRRADRVVVSVFVNPTQFGPAEDFGRYPRTWDADLAALADEQVDVVWAPTPEVMYPEGFATRLSPEGPALAGLEDKFRPHFFGGVATVVAKLFLQCRPDVAIFGQKDFQQLKVVTRLARDLDLPLKVIGAPTLREKDGLALSSRNVYLSTQERAVAPALHKALSACAQQIRNGQIIAKAVDAARDTISRAGFAIDYVEARHAETLAPIHQQKDGPIRLLVAAKIGTTRLIDNIPV